MTGGLSEPGGPQSGVRSGASWGGPSASTDAGGASVATVDRRGVGIYLLVTFGVAWAAEAVIALTGGLATPMARLALPVLMFAPMLGSWVACRRTRRPWASAVGLTREAWASGGWKRILLTVLVGMVVVLALGVATIALAAACGWLRIDTSLPGLDPVLARLPAAGRPPKVVLLVAQLVNVPIAACTINGFLALGEETGWRGYLLGALAPLGRRRPVLLVGAIWGLWHAPLIAMGYEYDHEVPFVVGVVLFVCFSTAFGVLLAWLRVRSGSVVPAAIAHGTLNATALLPALFTPVDQFRLVWASIAGVPGVIVCAVLAALLLVLGFAPRPGRR